MKQAKLLKSLKTQPIFLSLSPDTAPSLPYETEQWDRSLFTEDDLSFPAFGFLFFLVPTLLHPHAHPTSLFQQCLRMSFFEKNNNNDDPELI